ncbi:hypothetical protein EYC80_002779 [Monilinia laxa]|uniref:Heterokaryon incompatibility domain-containing protein n=1 Tax=Monilinia laxa TaxID=61186 RepID=A0A5N6KBR8_MONLA|nr:hypothetical protein EYC80_002779 [Monilinia laxa]
MSSPYLDIPLLRPDKQIRLLRLEPSSSNSDVYHFSLAVHDFNDDIHPTYIAISYTWGDTVPLLPIVVNGKKTQVQFNCWYSLWQMRYHGFTDYLWIDSLCINQDDDEEKNFQVSIMGSIYESALWVASCLGTGETIGVIQSALTSDDRDARLARINLRQRFDQLPYFDRVWIKQEIILARDITLFYGLEKLSWETFNMLINTVEMPSDLQFDSGDSASIDLFGVSNNHELWDKSCVASQEFDLPLHETEKNSTTVKLCNHRSSSKSETFVNLVLRYRTAKSTNPRDKIYALLSLIPKENIIRQSLVIDYGQPTFYLFHTIVRLVYYSTHENVKVGDKHLVLKLVGEWLGIDENNPEMDNYLRSIPNAPSDWLPSSTSDLSNSWVKGFDPYIMLDVIEICHIRPEDELGSNLNLKSEGYKPLNFLEHINTWRRDDQKWSKTEMNQLLPAKLETAKVTFTWPDLHSDVSPGTKEFLVNPDVRAGDFIAVLVWSGTENLYYETDQWTAAHAVFRAIDVKDQDKEVDRGDQSAMSVSEEIMDDTCVSYMLHSWAIPVRKDLTLLTRGEDCYPYNRNLDHESVLGELKLHHRDALIPLILDHTPLHALMYPAPESSSFSTLQLGDGMEPGSHKRQTDRSLKRKADYDYIRDILG